MPYGRVALWYGTMTGTRNYHQLLDIEKKMGAMGAFTSWLISQTRGDFSLVSEVDVPALGLAGLILQGEGEDGIALLDGVLALSIITLESAVDELEGLGGGECS